MIGKSIRCYLIIYSTTIRHVLTTISTHWHIRCCGKIPCRWNCVQHTRSKAIHTIRIKCSLSGCTNRLTSMKIIYSNRIKICITISIKNSGIKGFISLSFHISCHSFLTFQKSSNSFTNLRLT